MTKDEALKLALEYVELVPDDRYNAEHIDREALVTAIKEALAQPEHGWTPERIAGMARLKDAQDKKLAQPEQEPVAWRYKILDYFGRPVWTFKTPKTDIRVFESQPLYTSPPQRTWVGLTDEEVDECYYWKDRLWTTDELVRHVEAKLKEKNT